MSPCYTMDYVTFLCWPTGQLSWVEFVAMNPALYAKVRVGNILAKSSSDTNRGGIVEDQIALDDLAACCLHSGHARTYPVRSWSIPNPTWILDCQPQTHLHLRPDSPSLRPLFSFSYCSPATPPSTTNTNLSVSLVAVVVFFWHSIIDHT